MIGLLTIVLLAAFVGIIKPYIRPMRRIHFAGAAIITFITIMIVTASQSTDRLNASGKMPVADASAPSDKASELEHRSNWSYMSTKDDMRGTSSHFAEVTSDNTVDLSFPYGETHGIITLRKNPESGLNVMFGVEKGQILCHSYSESHILVKFDNGPVLKMSCTGARDGSSETAFIVNEGRMLTGLRKAKKTMIEAEFFQKWGQQFTFDTEGLVWK